MIRTFASLARPVDRRRDGIGGCRRDHAPAQAQEKVLRAVLHADVRTLDPFWTTQTIAGIHGMLVYDTLFGNDEDGNAEAADGRQLRHQRRPQDLHVHAARRTEIPRRQRRSPART